MPYTESGNRCDPHSSRKLEGPDGEANSSHPSGLPYLSETNAPDADVARNLRAPCPPQGRRRIYSEHVPMMALLLPNAVPSLLKCQA
jgi:hypothetical protein